ncbi:MAG: hypothetical protein H7Z21_00765, partial [Hymenobacter sp.]|nr:hypothetical protein [Hymenobacter sp.]
MGIYLLSYGISFDELRQSFASKDARLFQKILYSEEFVNYAAQGRAGHVPVKEAIWQIIYGEKYNEHSAGSYGYALICICSVVGIDLSGASSIKITYETDLIDEYLASDFGVEGVDCYDDLCVGGIDLGLPPVEDFPGIGILQTAGITALHQQLKHVIISGEQVEALLANRSERGDAYQGIGDGEAALAQWELARAQTPEDDGLLARLANQYEAAGRYA